jgi:hypothetical protein
MGEGSVGIGLLGEKEGYLFDCLWFFLLLLLYFLGEHDGCLCIMNIGHSDGVDWFQEE